jgi:hypothetical protein
MTYDGCGQQEDEGKEPQKQKGEPGRAGEVRKPCRTEHEE